MVGRGVIVFGVRSKSGGVRGCVDVGVRVNVGIGVGGVDGSKVGVGPNRAGGGVVVCVAETIKVTARAFSIARL